MEHLLRGSGLKRKLVTSIQPSFWIFWSSLVACFNSQGIIKSTLFSKQTHSLSTRPFGKMKSIVYGPSNEPIWKDLRRPTNIKRDQVLIRVQAVGLNPVDAKGVIGDKLPYSWTTLQSIAQRCIVKSKVIGFDFAGVVEETGGTDSSFARGDRVYGILPPSRHGGTLQEYLCVSVDQIACIPDQMSMPQAASLPLVGITALQCLRGAGWEQDRHRSGTLLVIGASGGTGHVAVQIGRALQPEAKIVAVCSGRNKAFVQTLDQSNNITVLDYRDEHFIDNLKAEAPYDVVMDCVTSGDPRDQANMDYGQLLWQQDGNSQLSSSPLLAPHSQYRRLGGVFPDWCRAAIERSIGVSLWSNARSKLFWIQMHNAAPALQQMAGWLRNGDIPVGAHVALTVPFTPAGVQEAFDALLGRRLVGKVVVEMPESDVQAADAAPTVDLDKKES